jgi:chromosome segregation ATPase
MAPQPRPVDPDARIPDAVRRAAARADEFYKKPESEPNSEEEGNNAQEQNNTQDSGNGEAASSPDVKVSSQASERARRRQERQRSDQSEPAEGTAERTTEQITEHVQQLPQIKTDQDESWERKFNAMKGRWENANQQLHNQGQQIQNLQNVIASMQTQQTQHASQEQTTQREVESTLTQEEREQYGDEFLNVVAKKAHEIVGPLKKELEGKIKQLDQQLGNVGQHVTQQAARQDGFRRLDRCLGVRRIGVRGVPRCGGILGDQEAVSSVQEACAGVLYTSNTESP